MPVLGTGPALPVAFPKQPREPVFTRSGNFAYDSRQVDSTVGASVGLLGAASAFAPALAPAAAAVGLGYGIYKFGDAVGIW